MGPGVSDYPSGVIQFYDLPRGLPIKPLWPTGAGEDPLYFSPRCLDVLSRTELEKYTFDEEEIEDLKNVLVVDAPAGPGPVLSDRREVTRPTEPGLTAE